MSDLICLFESGKWGLIGALLLMGACQPKSESVAGPKDFIVAFYNVENLFDTEDAPNKLDEDFLPTGRYKWTNKEYLTKLDNLARAIAEIDSSGPALVGLAEVENRQVVEDLAQLTRLKSRRYQIIHEESDDMRGIDLALLYDPSVFTYINHEARRVNFPLEPHYTSRQVLKVEGEIGGERIFVLVNHWPSKRDGPEISEPRRLAAANTAKALIQEIQEDHPDAGILVMGDFNDDPHERSLQEVMGALADAKAISEHTFYNPYAVMHKPETQGTCTYQGKWNLFDQILISEDLLDDTGIWRFESAHIHQAEFLQVGGNGRSKDMPRRAIYRGEFQADGYSDHFPVFVKIRSSKN